LATLSSLVKRLYATKNPKIALGILALQDGLGFKKMKSLETFGNCKKLKYR
jgi:hypothetical protein